MFAYCGNNPVNAADPSGYFWNEVFGGILSLLGSYFYVSMMEIAEQNYIHNSAIDADPKTTTRNRIVNDQNGTTGNSFMYGYYMAQHNGCEAIAIHNAKCLLGMDTTLSQTMYDCQLLGAIVDYGYFGSNPYELGNVLNYYDISYSNVQLNEMNQIGVYIISFWNTDSITGGLHTVAVYYDGSNYTTYNYEGYGKAFPGLPNCEGRYICGYYLGG